MQNINSKASILLTVYSKSSGKFLDECFKSIYDQTHLPNEVLLIQEGEIASETHDVIEKWKLKFKRTFSSGPAIICARRWATSASSSAMI